MSKSSSIWRGGDWGLLIGFPLCAVPALLLTDAHYLEVALAGCFGGILGWTIGMLLAWGANS